MGNTMPGTLQRYACRVIIYLAGYHAQLYFHIWRGPLWNPHHSLHACVFSTKNSANERNISQLSDELHNTSLNQCSWAIILCIICQKHGDDRLDVNINHEAKKYRFQYKRTPSPPLVSQQADPYVRLYVSMFAESPVRKSSRKLLYTNEIYKNGHISPAGETFGT